MLAKVWQVLQGPEGVGAASHCWALRLQCNAMGEGGVIVARQCMPVCTGLKHRCLLYQVSADKQSAPAKCIRHCRMLLAQLHGLLQWCH